MAKIHADPVLSLENVALAYVKFRGVYMNHEPSSEDQKKIMAAMKESGNITG